ncbi:helix-turn-helix domain-containing protein [Terasakiella pusilla]|uniref:helix-turn-helix domain-containing protein n=1 Tax=Terasakiella pusilla TaxID=64973 RepID=UPI00068DDBC9|nr:XRE family transcriptional regulator [Terasakiella pusilla]
MTIIEIEEVEGSVYNSLHDEKTALDMTLKADLVHQILAFKEMNDLNQTQLGELIDMDQADVSRMLRGNFRNIAVSKILNCLSKLSYDVDILLKPHPVANETGVVRVLETA